MIATTSAYHTTRNGTNLHIIEAGKPDGLPVILLHGLGGSTDTFTSLLPRLEPEKNRLISVDLEGFGKTGLSSPGAALSIPRYVDDVESLVAFLQGPLAETHDAKVLFIGHSLGAIIAMHYAAKHPDHVRGLALLGAGRSIANIPAAKERMLGLAATTRTDGIEAAAGIATVSNFPVEGDVLPQHRDSVREAVARCDPEGYARGCEALAGRDHVDPEYGRIVAPTVFIAGGGDIISPPERSLGLKELVGENASVKVIEGVGHQMILQSLEETVAAITGLLSRL